MFGDVLIVDDEKDIRDLMAGILVDEGIRPVQRRTATPHCGRYQPVPVACVARCLASGQSA